MSRSETAPENLRSIAQVNRMLRSILEAETLEQFFWVGGKIDRFHKSERGHAYFELVDDRARIRCTIWEERAGSIPFDLHNNLDVEVLGDFHFYEERGEAQINVVDLRVADKSSAIAPAIERLRAEGLYPPAKRPPPTDIRRIGIVTSQSSRAIGDFESAYQSAGERGVLAPVRWKYALLEGDRARPMLVDAIRSLDGDTDVDLIAVIRGGGRQESFAAFNSYEVASAIIQSSTFVVTGIGHHKDSTLADEAADHAASTPTAVAHFIAELCLRSRPSTAAALARESNYILAARQSDRLAASQDSRSSATASAPGPGRHPPERGTRAANAAVVVLLIAAIAMALLLIALLFSQGQ